MNISECPVQVPGTPPARKLVRQTALESPPPPKKTTSKRRRERLILLANAVAEDKARMANASLAERLSRVEARLDSEFPASSKAEHHPVSIASCSTAGAPAIDAHDCPRCKARDIGEDGSCWCFDLYCAGCESLALFCACSKPSFQKKECDTCGYTEALPGYTLADLADNGYAYGEVAASQGDDDSFTQCSVCVDGLVAHSFCYVGHLDVCGECHKISNQEAIQPCASAECKGDEEAMFHTQCMVYIGEDMWQCRTCHAVNAPLEGDGESDDESGSESQDDSIQNYAGLTVGDSYFNGRIVEIYPTMNKVCVEYTSANGVEIQHLKLDKVLSKVQKLAQRNEITVLSENLDSMD